MIKGVRHGSLISKHNRSVVFSKKVLKIKDLAKSAKNGHFHSTFWLNVSPGHISNGCLKCGVEKIFAVFGRNSNVFNNLAQGTRYKVP